MAVRYNLFDSFFLEDKQMQDLSLPKMSCIKRNKTSGKKNNVSDDTGLV